MSKKLKYIFIVAFVGRLILAFVVWHPDLNNHIDWGIRFFQYGAAKFYAPQSNIWSFTWPNQPPGTIYMFAGIRKLYEGLFWLFSFLHFKVRVFPGSFLLFFEKTLYPALLKLPSVVADLGIAYLIYKFVELLAKDSEKVKKLAFWGAVIWLFNPVSWYNSAVWGQTDAVINFLAIFAFYLLVKKRLALSFLMLVLSFYIKASLLIFVPIYLIIALKQKYPIKDYIISVLLSGLVIGLITLPFSQGEPFGWLINLYNTKVFGQQLQIITANGFNIWAAIAGIHERPQTLLLGPLQYKLWGEILFVIFYIPTLYAVWRKQDVKTVVWVLSIAAFSSFMLLTNMHERYLYPLFPYMAILIAANLFSIYPYILISIVNLLNLYNFWWFPKINLLISFLSFGNRLMPRVLGGVSFILYLQFYIKGFLQNLLRHRQD